MAEFTEVMRHAKRMCDAIVGGRCHECTLWRPETESCSLYGDDDGVDYADMERRVMAWAAEHPPLRYPTWREWQESTFSGATASVFPCSYVSRADLGCCGVCDTCRNEPIPADIAAKLGIKPIDPDRFSCNECRYREKPVLEEPCARCRRAEAPGSVGWAEMPDLWEVNPGDD